MDNDNDIDNISIIIDFTGGLQGKNTKLHCKCSRSQPVCNEYDTNISGSFKLEYFNNNVLNGRIYMYQTIEYVSHNEVLFGKPLVVEYSISKEKKCFIIVEPNKRLNKEKKEYSTLSPQIWNQLFIQLKKRLDLVNTVLWDVFSDLIFNYGDDEDEGVDNGIDYTLIINNMFNT